MLKVLNQNVINVRYSGIEKCVQYFFICKDTLHLQNLRDLNHILCAELFTSLNVERIKTKKRIKPTQYTCLVFKLTK